MTGFSTEIVEFSFHWKKYQTKKTLRAKMFKEVTLVNHHKKRPRHLAIRAPNNHNLGPRVSIRASVQSKTKLQSQIKRDTSSLNHKMLIVKI